MIGYISSAGQDFDTSNAEITVIYADGFGVESEWAPKEIYSYNRASGKIIQPRNAADVGERVPYGLLLSVVDLLKLEETKSGMAMKLWWKENFAKGAEVVHSEYLNGVWFPSPVLTDGCKKPCLNITGILYDYVPSTLETSIFCDVANMIFCQCEINISAPFYCICNSVFVSSDAIKLFDEIFEDLLSASNLDSKHTETIKNLIMSERGLKESKQKIKDKLSAIKYEEKEYSGTRHNFAINIKRSCMREITALVLSCLNDEISVGDMIREMTLTIRAYTERFITLSELFAVTENLERASDIKFLTLYELMSAYAFSEHALALKKTVRKGKEKITHLNKTKVPCTLFPDGRCI